MIKKKDQFESAQRMDSPAVLPIILQPSHLRPLAYRILSKKHGLNIKSDGLSSLAEFIGPKYGSQWKETCVELLESIATTWKEQDRGIFIDASVSEVLKDVTERPHGSVSATPEVEDVNWQDYYKVIDAFEQQNFSYDYHRKQYIYKPPSEHKVLPDQQSRVTLFASRYHVVRDRVLRNESFQNDDFNPLSSIQEPQQNMSLTQIKNLLGRHNQTFLLLGLLKKTHTWFLEDPSDSIELEMSQAAPEENTYYVPGCLVLVHGMYLNNKFYVSHIYHPPAERREVTLEAIGNLDLLGIHGQSTPSFVSRIDNNLKLHLNTVEKDLHHRMVFFGGDIFLDDTATMEALRKVLTVLEQEPPLTLVLNGSFISQKMHPSMSSKSISSTMAYKNLWDTLASLLQQFPGICHETTIVFVPGPNDPWFTSFVPQRGIPKVFGSRVSRVAKKVVWASNPCRIVYLSQEIVLSRQDISQRLKKECVVFEEEEDSEPNLLIDKIPTRVLESRKIVKTILDQGHLAPFLEQAIVWDLDNVLSLNPLPTTLLLCDATAPSFDVTYNGCKVFNPGKFVYNRRVQYTEYFPSLKKSISQEISI